MFLKNKFVRDLEFAIFSNSLLNFDQSQHDILFGLNEFQVRDWIYSLEENPSELEIFIETQNSIRLGKYFENLLHFYFLWNFNVDVIDYSKQIFEGKNTLGELDFILFIKPKNRYLHLEVAVKYFVKRQGFCDYENFICPNGERNLKRKIDKTFEKQLQILEYAPAKEYLIEKGIFNIESRILIRGAIFYFSDEKDVICEDLNFVNTHTRYVSSKISEFKAKENRHYKFLKNHFWLTENRFESSENIVDKFKILELLKVHFQTSTRGWVIGEYELVNGFFVEREKIAVVHDKWPEVT